MTIPKEVRAGVPEGTLLVAARREDDVIELRPQATVDASPAWFWTERRQRMGAEANDDIARRRVKRFDDVEAFLSDVDHNL